MQIKDNQTNERINDFVNQLAELFNHSQVLMSQLIEAHSSFCETLNDIWNILFKNKCKFELCEYKEQPRRYRIAIIRFNKKLPIVSSKNARAPPCNLL